MSVAANLNDVKIALTDLPSAVPTLSASVANAQNDLQTFANVTVFPLDWRALECQSTEGTLPEPRAAAATIAAALPRGFEFDVVFGADLTWCAETSEGLSVALAAFVAASQLRPPRRPGAPRVVYGHWNRSGPVTEQWLRMMAGRGVAARVLHPCGWEPRPSGFLDGLVLPPTGEGPPAAPPPPAPAAAAGGGPDPGSDDEGLWAEVFGDEDDADRYPAFLVFELLPAPVHCLKGGGGLRQPQPLEEQRVET